jgi:hypothetical protein
MDTNLLDHAIDLSSVDAPVPFRLTEAAEFLPIDPTSLATDAVERATQCLVLAMPCVCGHDRGDHLVAMPHACRCERGCPCFAFDPEAFAMRVEELTLEELQAFIAQALRRVHRYVQPSLRVVPASR